MSNNLVGTVYQAIIDEVISSSQVDFEEAGVNASTLADLKQVWQQKLSDMKVASFPWDPPEPEQQRLAGNVAQQAQKAGHGQQSVQIKQETGSAGYGQANGAGGVRIKAEPGLEHAGGVYGAPPLQQQLGNPTHDPQIAQMRAQQNIAQKFGPHQIQARPGPQNGLVLPMAGAPQQQPHHQPQQQYHPQYQNHTLPQQQQRVPNGAVNGGQQPPQPQRQIQQHDGAEDDDEELIPVEGFGLLTRAQADRILLRHIENAERKGAQATAELAEALQSLQMQPDKGKSKAQAPRRRRAKKQDAYDAVLDPTTSFPWPAAVGPSSSRAAENPAVPQLDGDDDHETADEDAINSDLDDPDENELESDEDSDVPQIMLCMYDKVQRTKNKWKCVLKDGVLTINGKEYVFHKANGEYEW